MFPLNGKSVNSFIDRNQFKDLTFWSLKHKVVGSKNLSTKKLSLNLTNSLKIFRETEMCRLDNS